MNLRSLNANELLSRWVADGDTAVAAEIVRRADNIELDISDRELRAELLAELARVIDRLRAVKAKADTLSVVADDLATELDDITDALQELNDND